MPAKGSKFSLANRDYIFNKAFYDKYFVEENNLKLSFKECKDIIETCNKNIAKAVIEEIDGFKLPFGLGYVCAGKFIPEKPAIDWKKTKEIKKKVYYLNFHTLGYSVRLYWFRVGKIRNFKFHTVLYFKPYKTLSSAVSKAFTNGKVYTEWTNADFIEKGRLEKLYTKKYRKEQNEL